MHASSTVPTLVSRPERTIIRRSGSTIRSWLARNVFKGAKPLRLSGALTMTARGTRRFSPTSRRRSTSSCWPSGRRTSSQYTPMIVPSETTKTPTTRIAFMEGSSIGPAARARTSRSAAGCPPPPAARCTSAGCRSRGTGRRPGRPARCPVRSNRKMSCIVMTSPSMPGDLGDGGHLARAVRQARDLDDELDGRRNLLADGPVRDVQVGHRDHRVEAVQRVARAVGVDRRRDCRRGRCSWPAACRAPRRRAPRRR